MVTYQFTVKDSFHFAEEIVNKLPDFFIAGLDVDSLVTIVLPEETVEIWANDFFKEFETVQYFSKFDFKELKTSSRNLNGTLSKQIDFMTIGTPVSPALANIFLVYHEI